MSRITEKRRGFPRREAREDRMEVKRSRCCWILRRRLPIPKLGRAAGLDSVLGVHSLPRGSHPLSGFKFHL